MSQSPVKPMSDGLKCAACGGTADGNRSIHRDGFGEGPEVPLCNGCGMYETPRCEELWERIAKRMNGYAEGVKAERAAIVELAASGRARQATRGRGRKRVMTRREGDLALQVKEAERKWYASNRVIVDRDKELAAANKQIDALRADSGATEAERDTLRTALDALRAELAEAKAFVDFTRLHVCNAKGHTFIRDTSQTECPFCERDELRAELENLRRHNTTWTVDWERQRARADKAEAELAARTAERDRLVKEKWELGTRADEADEALAALRQSTEAAAERARHLIAAAWSDPAPVKPVSSPDDLGRSYIEQMGKMVAPVPAPSPPARTACSFCQDTEPRILNGDNSASVCGGCAGMHWDICRPDDPSPAARAEAPVAYARNVNGVWKGISLASDEDRSYLDAAVRDWGGTVHALYTAPPVARAEEPACWTNERDGKLSAFLHVSEAQALEAGSMPVALYRAPPDLTAEIARLMMEKERKQHMIEEQLAEIAKLKAQLDGTRREKIVTGWLACNDDPDSTCLWFPTKKAARKRLAMWRDSRSRSRLWLVRLVRKPASGGGT